MGDVYEEVLDKLISLILDVKDIVYVVDGSKEDGQINRKKNNLKNILLGNLDAAYATAKYLYDMEVNGEEA